MQAASVIVFVLASAVCALAHLQSPIDIESDLAVTLTNLPELTFPHYSSSQSTYYLANSGHGAQVTVSNWLHRPRARGGPLNGTYMLEQVHFHWGEEDGVGSEHWMDGSPFSMEVHFVHWNKKYGSYEKAAQQPDGLAVVAFFIEGLDNYRNTQFQKLVDLIPQIKDKTGAKVEAHTDLLAWALPNLESGGYFTYAGSLTTAPFSENVRWIVYDNPVVIGRKQIAAFREIENSHREILLSNKRDLQQVDGREVDYVPLQY